MQGATLLCFYHELHGCLCYHSFAGPGGLLAGASSYPTNTSVCLCHPTRPQVKEGYFQGLVAAGRVTAEEVGEHIFASKPAAGGAVLNLKL